MIQSDLEFDKDNCKQCGRPLWDNYGGKRTRELLREYDGDIVFALMVDIRCGYCGGISTIFYQAEMLPSVSTRGTATTKRRFAWAAAV